MAHIVGGIHPVAAIFPEQFQAADVREVAGLHPARLPFLQNSCGKVYPVGYCLGIQDYQLLITMAANAIPTGLYNTRCLLLALQPDGEDIFARHAPGRGILGDDDGQIADIRLAEFSHNPVAQQAPLSPILPERNEQVGKKCFPDYETEAVHLMLQDMPETFGQPDDNLQLEHSRLVECIRGTTQGLTDTGKTGPTVEVARLLLRSIPDGTAALEDMLSPSLCHTVGIAHALLQNLHVGIAEMQEIEVGVYMEVVPLYTMETTAPLTGLGNDGGLGVTRTDLGIQTLMEEWPVLHEGGLLANLLAEVKA